MVSSFEVS